MLRRMILTLAVAAGASTQATKGYAQVFEFEEAARMLQLDTGGLASGALEQFPYRVEEEGQQISDLPEVSSASTAATILDISRLVQSDNSAEAVELARDLITGVSDSPPIASSLEIVASPLAREIDLAESLRTLERSDEFVMATASTAVPASNPRVDGRIGFGSVPEYAVNFQRALEPEAGSTQVERVYQGLQIAATESLADDPYSDAVAVINSQGGICSGTLVAPDKVVYAAHCFCRGVNEEVRAGQSLFTPLKTIKVDRSRSKSLLDCGTHRQDIAKGDAAVLTLAEPLSDARPRLIASQAMVVQAASVRAAGFGRTEANVVGFKFIVDVIIATPDCDGPKQGDLLMRLLPEQLTSLGRVTYEVLFGCTAKLELVAAGARRDTAPGDSGGGIYVLGADGRLYLAGITSRGVSLTETAGSGGVYVLTSSEPVRKFLMENGIPESSFAQ